ncbi:hypothetical protein CWI75_01115 [Kineobactrum sediminis]|uniref:Flagellar biosynthesis protein FlaG n=1 Tax=Kineobactrum sediminis TaxID=1905677 RepID=A0A2N5Y6I0_9GAMM|nr:flagellar protein FlaG [Kineobactrum sediminis]PLW83982.1 hypothetical protein CWI75_01115 [Kineobactrum sediminis]
MDNTISGSQLQNRVAPEARPLSAPRPVTTPTDNSGPPVAVAPPPEPGAVTAETGEKLRESLEALSERLNEFVQDNSRELEFMVSEEASRIVILVRQSETGEVLRTIPPEEAMTLAENLRQGGAALFSQQA